MALQASGPISFGDVATEFSLSHPVSMSQMYGLGGVVTSGPISLSVFYGASASGTPFSADITLSPVSNQGLTPGTAIPFSSGGFSGSARIFTNATGWDAVLQVSTTIIVDSLSANDLSFQWHLQNATSSASSGTVTGPGSATLSLAAGDLLKVVSGSSVTIFSGTGASWAFTFLSASLTNGVTVSPSTNQSVSPSTVIRFNGVGTQFVNNTGTGVWATFTVGTVVDSNSNDDTSFSWYASSTSQAVGPLEQNMSTVYAAPGDDVSLVSQSTTILYSATTWTVALYSAGSLSSVAGQTMSVNGNQLVTQTTSGSVTLGLITFPAGALFLNDTGSAVTVTVTAGSQISDSFSGNDAGFEWQIKLLEYGPTTSVAQGSSAGIGPGSSVHTPSAPGGLPLVQPGYYVGIYYVGSTNSGSQTFTQLYSSTTFRISYA